MLARQMIEGVPMLGRAIRLNCRCAARFGIWSLTITYW